MAVFDALRESESKNLVRHFGVAAPAGGSTCATVRMERLGPDLASFFGRIKRTAHIVRILRHMLLALADLHALGVVHRAIKPSNFLLDRACNTLKLCDFEQAVRAQPVMTAELTKLSGAAAAASVVMAMCTPLEPTLFTAPEAYPERNNGYATATGDLWSVGVILHAIVTGAMPFYGTRNEALDAILDYASDPLPLRHAFTTAAQAAGFTDDQCTQLLGLHVGLLSYRPQKRMHAHTALQSPLFCSPLVSLPPPLTVPFVEAAAALASKPPAAAAAAVAADAAAQVTSISV
jgi:serine/threonine protein kinase